MRKFLFIVSLFMICMTAVTLNAQSQTELPQTVRATVSAGGNADHFYVAIGQPFFTQETLGDYELSMGVAEAQWVRDTVYDVITYKTPYTKYGFDLEPQTTTHKDSVYLVNGGIYNYDLWRTLFLIVCDSAVADIQESNLLYDVLAVSGHCWTKQNLRTPVEGATAYQSSLNTEVPENYGLLYTLNAALNNTTPDEDGYVKGICPAKWHLPDAAEIADLITNPADALRSTEGWFGVTNTNSTDFTAYPAGLYNSAIGRFEGLGTQTDWWTTANAGTFGMATEEPTSGAVETLRATSLQIDYYCDTPRLIVRNPDDAVSVRCVMKNEWPE